MVRHSSIFFLLGGFPFALRCFYGNIHAIYAAIDGRVWVCVCMCEAKCASFISFHSCQLDSIAIFSAHKRNIYDTCVSNSKSIWFSIIGARIVRYIDSDWMSSCSLFLYRLSVVLIVRFLF